MDRYERASERASERAPLRGRWPLLCAVVCGVLACATAIHDEGLRGVAPQDWWDGRGPVVPHDTFPADCSLCHTSESWAVLREDFTFDHAAETGVPLSEPHRAAECLRCHNDRGPVEVFASRGCAGCHEDVHMGDFGTDCVACHAEETWRVPDMVAEHRGTRFPLIGAHAAVACWRCHEGAEVGNFVPVDVECISCHLDDLERADDPDHLALGFPLSCDECHAPTSWDRAGFAHPFFRLDGAHAAIDCAACHADGFGGTPTACFDCHMDDWFGAEPDHAAAGFPMTCQQCHNASDWDDVDFDHAFFPIQGGDHGRLDCADCHPTGASTFTCTSCHEHSKSEMDDEHDDVGDYLYQSPACLACHPNGKE